MRKKAESIAKCRQCEDLKFNAKNNGKSLMYFKQRKLMIKSVLLGPQDLLNGVEDGEPAFKETWRRKLVQ